jgi:uncharacterized membrane protein YkoI
MKAIALSLAALCALAYAAPAPPPAAEKRLELDEAAPLARKVVPGTIEHAALERQENRLVWSFDVRASSEDLKLVWLDAQTGAVLKVESQGPREKLMYVGATRQQLDEISAKIEGLRREAESRTAETRSNLEAQAAALDVKRKQAEKELTEAEAAGAERWKRFQAGLDRSIEELRRAYEEAVSSATMKTPPEKTKR